MLKDKNIATAAAIATSKLAEDSGITSSHIGSSKVLAANVASSAVLDRHLSSKLRTGFIPLDLSKARRVGSSAAGVLWDSSAIAGGRLSVATVPQWQVISTLARAARLLWSSAATDLVQLPPIPTPPDWSTLSSATINVLACNTLSTGSTNDTAPKLNFKIYNSTGSSQAAVVLTVSSLGKSTQPAHYSTAIPATQLPSPNSFMTITLGCTSTADNIACYGAWIEYQRNSTA